MNRLEASTSLYLKQHADNPVEWYPWGPEALDRAQALDRPILLSIGYSACHWCHVMAHESFEDPDTARVMNELYINVKVDREERPDLDRVYQLSHQLLTGRGGGWPLTLLLDPADLTPFFAGTYFPREPRHGLPAFRDLLARAREWFDDHRDEISAQNQRLQETVAALQGGEGAPEVPGEEVFTTATTQLGERFDRQHGGFGGAPKFPQAPLLALVQGLAARTGGDEAAAMLRATLHKMAISGLRDHLDGGFFRYAVDGSWTIPHFEKMLYDNALLLPLYAESAARWRDGLLREAATGIAEWLCGEMQHPEGGFYASIDADADGVEGGFHVWQVDEIRTLLDDDAYRALADAFDLASPPNFEGRAWHLQRSREEALAPPLREALDTLRAARAARVPPTTDTKRLTAWNALCAEGLVRAGAALGNEGWVDAAERTMRLLARRLWIDDRLHAVLAGDEVQFPAYLDDHAFLLQASLALLEERWRPEYLQLAARLADQLLDHFQDNERGGFFFSTASEPVPIHRMRPFQDDATPGGNGVAAHALVRLGHLLAEPRYLDAAQRTLRAASTELGRYPLAHASLLCALDEFLDPPTQVILAGANREELMEWQAIARGGERLRCYLLDPDAEPLPGILGAYRVGERSRAFVCKGTSCQPPLESGAALAAELGIPI